MKEQKVDYLMNSRVHSPIDVLIHGHIGLFVQLSVDEFVRL